MNSVSSKMGVVTQSLGSGMPNLAASTAAAGYIALQAAAASVAPASCAIIYIMARGAAIRRVERKPIVTAGLKCAPLIPAKMLTAIESAIPCASAMPTKPAPLLTGSDVATMAPMPAKHRKKVPIASANSCLYVYMGLFQFRLQSFHCRMIVGFIRYFAYILGTLHFAGGVEDEHGPAL